MEFALSEGSKTTSLHALYIRVPPLLASYVRESAERQLISQADVVRKALLDQLHRDQGHAAA